MRKEVPGDIWVHVLGITALPYYKEWCKIGIDSVDGSSFLQKAIRGVFTYYKQGKIFEFNCARSADEPKDDFLIYVGSECQAPPCDCRACLLLKEKNINPRLHSNCELEDLTKSEKLYGRAFHNLNQLIKGQKDTYKKLKKDNENK